jgi:hypothetical protein
MVVVVQVIRVTRHQVVQRYQHHLQDHIVDHQVQHYQLHLNVQILQAQLIHVMHHHYHYQ